MLLRKTVPKELFETVTLTS